MNRTTLAVALACSAVVQAQSPLSGLAQGVVLKESTGERELQRKPAGDLPVTNFTSVGANAPVYSMEALLHHLGQSAPGAAAGLRLNAMSTGNDILPINAYPNELSPTEFRVFSPQGALWAALALTVDGGATVSAEPGTVFEDRLSTTTNIGADIFSYWFSTNAGLPSNLVDRAHLDVAIEGLAAGQQVSALDTYMPAILEDRMSPIHAILQVKDRWYFTLTPGSAQDIYDGWTQSDYQAAFACDREEIGANYVYQAQWNEPGGVAGWSQIDILFEPGDLGLVQTDVIDAIAYYRGINFMDRIVFSLRKNGAQDTRDQILVGGPLIPGGGHRPLHDGSGAKVTTKVGVGLDTDVDSICTYDPETLTDYYGPWIAFPVADPVHEGTEAGIGCSAARYRVSAGGVVGQRLRVQATGLPLALPGSVGFFIDVAGSVESVVVPVTDSRMEHVFSLPPALPQGTEITVYTAYASRAERLFSWDVRLKTD